MTREEIKEYLNRVDKLVDKLTGEDEETLNWLIYGYNQCAKLLNETEEENEKLKADYGTKAQVERDLLKEENEKLKAELKLYQGALKREDEAIHKVNDLEEVIDRIEKYIEKETRIYGLSMSKGLGIHFDNILGILKGGSNE